MLRLFSTLYRLVEKLLKLAGENIWSLVERAIGLFASVFGIIEFFKNWWKKRREPEEDVQSEQDDEKKDEEGSDQSLNSSDKSEDKKENQD